MPDNRKHINSDALKKYLSGSLNEADLKRFQEGMEEDAFEKEALEGYDSFEDKALLLAALKEVEKNVAEKTGMKSERKLVFPIWKTIQIAASVVLVLLGAFFINHFMKSEEQVAVNTTNSETQDVVSPEKETELVITEVPAEMEEAPVNESHREQMIEDLKQNIQNSEKEVRLVVEDNLAKNSKKQKELASPKPTVPAVVSEELMDSETFNDLEEVATSTIDAAGNYKTAAAVQNSRNAATKDESYGKSYFDTGLASYNAKEYNSAIDYFQDAINSQNNTTESEYYIGMCYYNINKLNKALKYFDTVIAKPSSSISNNAKWYKAIILEEKGNIDGAIQLLKDLATGNSGFKNQAQDKLNSLN